MQTWADIIAALDALLATPPESVDEVVSQLATVREAIAALMETASTETDEAKQTEAVTQSAEAEKKIGSIVAKVTTKINLQKAKNANIEAQKNMTLGGGVPSNLIVPQKGLSISGKSYRGKMFKSGEDAYKSGRFVAATMFNHKDSQDWLQQKGFAVKTMQEGNDALGGYLVPEELETAIIIQREKYGVFRANANVVGMSSESRVQYKSAGGAVVYAINELAAYTTSDISFTPVRLVARKWGAVTGLSKEVGDDAFLNIADQVADEHGQGFAEKEDQVGFNGDGTQAYHNNIGITYMYRYLLEQGGGTWITDADKLNLGSATYGTGSTWGSIVYADFLKLPALIRDDVGTDFAWYVSPQFFWTVMAPIIVAAGGQTQLERSNEIGLRFMGYPVKLTNVMPSATAVDQVCALFGNLSGAALLGDRQGVSMEIDTSLGFLSDLVYVKTNSRFGVNIYDVGNYNATAASRKRGSVAALITKHS